MRQPSPATSQVTSTPPSTCPAIPPSPEATPYQAVARARSPEGKVAVIRPSTCGNIMAAVRPCAIRATTSSVAFAASPHSSEVAANPQIPSTYIRRWP